MKNTIKNLGIITLAVVIGFIFTTCKDNDSINPFIGTWIGSHNDYGQTIEIKVLFTNTTWEMTKNTGLNSSTYAKGSYTYSSDTAKLSDSYFDVNGGDRGTATVIGNTLKLNYKWHTITETYTFYK